MQSTESWLPLKGIKIADFTQVIAGPACSMLLADMGAEVIKIEPHDGDFWRKTVRGSAFANFNRNKRSLAVNLKDPKGHEAIMKVVERADVFLENFTPGTMDKLNLGYEAVSRINPKIIYCSISGFGQEGPYRDRPGYDPVAQAMSGIMINTGEPQGPPVRVLPTMVDYLSGNHMAYAIALALLDREKTGQGKRIEIALLDVAIMQMGQFVAMYTMTGELPQRMGSGYLAAAPYQAFETQGWICPDRRHDRRNVEESVPGSQARSSLRQSEIFFLGGKGQEPAGIGRGSEPSNPAVSKQGPGNLVGGGKCSLRAAHEHRRNHRRPPCAVPQHHGRRGRPRERQD